MFLIKRKWLPKYSVHIYVLSSILVSPYLLYWMSGHMVTAGKERLVTGCSKEVICFTVGLSVHFLRSGHTYS